MAKSEDKTPFGEALLEGLREAAAWKRGEIALPVRNAPSLTSERVKAIRKSVAKTSREFSRRFGIPVRTLEGWCKADASPIRRPACCFGGSSEIRKVEDVSQIDLGVGQSRFCCYPGL